MLTGTKSTYGGTGSSNTKERVLQDSGLIEFLRSCLAQMERDIHLPGLTFKQGKRDMSQTYSALLVQMLKTHPNEYQGKRSTAYETPDLISTGTKLYTTGSFKPFENSTDAADDDMEQDISWDDIDAEGNFM